MAGGKLGWILAGALVVVVAGLLIFVVSLPTPSKPTSATMKEGFMTLHVVDLSPAVVAGSEPDAPGNAGDDYAQAIEAYKQNIDLLKRAGADLSAIAKGQKVLDRPSLVVLEQIAGHVAAGAKKKEMRYVLVHTPETFEVGYSTRPPTIWSTSPALSILATQHYAKKEYAAAEQTLQNQFVLGWHMNRERARVYPVYQGMLIECKAIGGLQMIYRDWEEKAGRADKLDEYDRQLRRVMNFYEDKTQVVWRIDRIEPGDTFNVVENDKDRAFRVQAILYLGILRYTTAKRGDVRKTRELIERFVNSADALEKAAAIAARDMTQEEFNTVGSR